MTIYNELNKQKIDHYLYTLAREYKKKSGRSLDAEVVLVGGASILLGYGFRNTTIDVDGLILASSAMKDAILSTADKFNLDPKWINDDFTKTDSYSPHLREYSSFYKTYAQILDVRIVEREYLIATKLVAAREDKHDLSDIVGIMKEAQEKKDNISFADIDKAICQLYGSWERVNKKTQAFITDICNLPKDELEELFYETIEQEAIKRKETIITLQSISPPRRK